MMKQLLYTFIILASIISCHNDESITGNEPALRYQLNEGNHATDVYARNFYESYGSFILYDNYQEKDYRWNISSWQDITIIKQADKDIAYKGIDFLKKVLNTDFYDITLKDNRNFKKAHFPLKIFLCDSIIENSAVKRKVHKFWTGVDYIALGNINTDIEKLSSDSINQLRGELNGKFWGEYLYKFNKIETPSAFINTTKKDLYGKSYSFVLGNDTIDSRTGGFLRAIKKDVGLYVPTAEEDIAQYIEYMCTHTEAEMKQIMNGYPLVEQKYNNLKTYLKTNFNLDLQKEVGDKYNY